MQLPILIILVVFNCFVDSADNPQCGRPNTTKRIVGGYDIGYYKYPWFAALLLNGEAWCGGTLIGRNTVLTAAHCYKEYIKKKGSSLERVFKVKLGVYNNCNTNEEYQHIYKVKKVHIHEKYWDNKPYFDIAMLILEGDTSAYLPACLPDSVKNSSTRGLEGWIQGLGTEKYDTDDYPCEVREARILIYSDKDCIDMLKAMEDAVDLQNAFCAGWKKGGIDSCQGDSGGPLLVLNHRSQYILQGITSFGFDCAAEDTYGIYTDVSHYLNWINEKVALSNTTIPDNSVNVGSTSKPVGSTDNSGQIIPTSFVIPLNSTNGYPKRIIIEFDRKHQHKKSYSKHGKSKARKDYN